MQTSIWNRGNKLLNIAKKRHSNRSGGPYPINIIWEGRVTKYLRGYEDKRLTDGVYRSESGEASHSSLRPPSVAMLPLTLKLNAVVRQDASGDFPPSAAAARLQTSKCKILLLRYRPNGGKKRVFATPLPEFTD